NVCSTCLPYPTPEATAVAARRRGGGLADGRLLAATARAFRPTRRPCHPAIAGARWRAGRRLGPRHLEATGTSLAILVGSRPSATLPCPKPGSRGLFPAGVQPRHGRRRAWRFHGGRPQTTGRQR